MDTLLELPYGHWDISLVGEFDPQEFWGFVYEIVHKSTGKSYIGRKQFKFKRQKTKSDKSRTKDSDWRDYNSSSELVQSLIEEMGSEDFEFRILKLCSGKCELNYEEESVQREKDVLRARLPNGELRFYNRTIGYKNFGGLEKQTEETKVKMRAAWTPERRAEIVEANKTRMTPEVREHCRQAALGKVISDETKDKMSMSHQNHFWWNNGVECRRRPECPGEGWIAGRLFNTIPK